MTNFELELAFQKVFENKDCFDNYLSLLNLKKEYKKTSFYKQTRMPLQKAYNLFVLNKFYKIINFLASLDNTEYIGNLITEYINNIDQDTLNSFLDRILNNFDPSNLKDIQAKLQTAITDLKIM